MARNLFLIVLILILFVGSFYVRSRLDKTTANSKTTALNPISGAVPKRIVSLSPSITEILFALGLDDRLIGVTRYCDYPPKACQKKQVGGWNDPNYETIIGLGPDLIIIRDDHKDAQKKLKQAGIRILPINHRTLDGIIESIQRIGACCGRQKHAQELLRDIRTRMDGIRKKARGLDRPSVMITIGRNMGTGGIKDIYIAGNEGFYSEMIKIAGGRNAVSDSVTFPSVSREGIISLNPDVIIDMVSDMNKRGWTREKIIRQWAALPMVSAVKHERVHVFTEDFVVIPGPRFILIIEKLARVIHPELFTDNQ